MKKISILVIVLVLSVLPRIAFAQTNSTYDKGKRAINQLLDVLDRMYVDTINFTDLTEAGMREIISTLDPHSSYTTAKDVAASREPLQGSFDGIGVTFQIIKDTINVIEVIIDGPSEKVGLLPGDKIIKVDTLVACGKEITNNWVRDHLRGKKGTKVTLYVKRGHSPDLLEFTITRGKIPLYSINVSFMVDDETGYIKLDRFAQTSLQEFRQAFEKLQQQGMKNLIFDLRGNGGGYLNTAFQISSQFIKEGSMIVYTDNFRNTGEKYTATNQGLFRKGKLIVLVDENSASASEITAGAIQDWDRGLIMGRRTYGKGLVQKPVDLVNGAEVRVTISHYYTPSGRCIQKPYDDRDDYFQDISKRYSHGEMFSPDSIQFPDSLKYKTLRRKRDIYGGGGIMPDIFIPMDTTNYSAFYAEVVRKGIISSYVMNVLDSRREQLKAQYPTFEEFKNHFTITDQMYEDFVAFAKQEGVVDSAKFLFTSRLELFIKEKKKELDSLYTTLDDLNKMDQLDKMIREFVQNSYEESVKDRNSEKSPQLIKNYMLFEFGRNLFTYGDGYQFILKEDATFKAACETMKNDKVFRDKKIDYK